MYCTRVLWHAGYGEGGDTACTNCHVFNILLMQVLHHTAGTDTILFGSGKSTDANSTWSAPRY